MFLLNLTAVEFFALLTAVSGFVVALYLLSRSRRKQVVATLRFWTQSQQPVPSKQRRRIQQPWSLLLQLLSLLLLLLAISQLRLGTRENSSRDHILLLDTSSWMAAKAGGRTLLDDAKAKARAYVRSLPATDRVMLVRAEGFATPATAMESNRQTLERSIDQSRPAAAALDLQHAFAFAQQVRRMNARNAGEIVYIGAGRVVHTGMPVDIPKALRVIAVEAPTENVGLAKLGLRRTASDREQWELFVSARNYGSTPKKVPIVAQFGGAPVGSRLIELPAAGTADAAIAFRTRAAGWLEVRLLGDDALAEDNRAILEIPAQKTLRLMVYTNDAEALRPALAVHSQVESIFRSPAEYTAKPEAQAVVLDRFVPASPPSLPAIWIDPPEGSPFKVRTRIPNAPITRWRAEHEISAGLRTKQLRLPSAAVFSLSPGDTSVADSDSGPVIVTRSAERAIALGFNPASTELKYDLATPLLLANVLRWIEPAVFQGTEMQTGSVGAVSVTLNAEMDPGQIRVLNGSQELPFTLRGRTLSFFSAEPGTIRIKTGEREQVYSLSLPEAGEALWQAPASVRKGTPPRVFQAFSRDVWQILAALGGFGLLVEWILFGRDRSLPPRTKAATAPTLWRKAS